MSDPAAANDGSVPPDWTAPDDPRELEPDLRAWRQERATAGRPPDPTSARPAGWRQFGTPGLVAALVIIGVAAVGGALVVGAPAGLPTGSAARPLATPSGTPGGPGGLLPEVTLRVGNTDRPARDLRPAVLALLPAPCQCAAALRELAAEAGQYALPMVLITRAGNSEVPSLLRATARATRTYPALDAGAALAMDYAARGLTVLLVRADGVVTVVERQLLPGTRFGSALSDLDA